MDFKELMVRFKNIFKVIRSKKLNWKNLGQWYCCFGIKTYYFSLYTWIIRFTMFMIILFIYVWKQHHMYTCIFHSKCVIVTPSSNKVQETSSLVSLQVYFKVNIFSNSCVPHKNIHLPCSDFNRLCLFGRNALRWPKTIAFQWFTKMGLCWWTRYTGISLDLLLMKYFLPREHLSLNILWAN